jgi:hypothetical protein
MRGRVTGVTSNSISNSSAGWTAGALSNPATPHLIRITSGPAAGRTFLISTTSPNTQTSIVIDPLEASQVDLTTLGISVGLTSGDTYQIIPCDTMARVFQTPATMGILGGNSAAAADTVMLSNNGVLMTYYFNTTLNRWTRSALGNPDASNTPIRPDAGLIYSRLGNSPISFTLLGEVPTTDRRALVRNSGVTYLSQGWPIDTTLAGTGLQNLPGWRSGATAAVSDTVQLMVAGAWRTYWYDGSQWRRQALGSPGSGTQTVFAAASLLINRIGQTTGASTLTQTKTF